MLRPDDADLVHALHLQISHVAAAQFVRKYIDDAKRENRPLLWEPLVAQLTARYRAPSSDRMQEVRLHALEHGASETLDAFVAKFLRQADLCTELSDERKIMQLISVLQSESLRFSSSMMYRQRPAGQETTLQEFARRLQLSTAAT